MLGDWTAICLRCGAARRWFEEFEAEIPAECPALRRRDAPPLPVVRGAVLVDVRGRLRGVRREAARAGARSASAIRQEASRRAGSPRALEVERLRCLEPGSSEAAGSSSA